MDSRATSGRFSYSYKPLDKSKREIRIMRLDPEQLDVSDPSLPSIQCSIEHISLDKAPKYTGLSYTWGSSDRTQRILVNGYELMVTENLAAWLRHTQKALTDYKISMSFWADAICINQDDDDEKCWQVQQMPDIYKTAQYVTVWLGPAAEDSDLAIVSLGKAGDELAAPVFAFEEFIWDRLGEFLQFTGKPPNDAPLEWRFAYLIREMAVRHGEAGGFPIEPIRALLQRPWWQRVWVLQEIALAKQVVICCGNKALPLSQFAHGMILMRVYHDHVRRKNDDPDPNVKVSEQESPILKANIDNRPSKMLHIRNKFDKMRIKGSLHSLLIQSCILNTKADSTLKATDPRDMIYGFLGLVTDENKGLIAPDYSKPCAEVYRLAVQVLIQSGGIAILSFCQFPKTQPGLPSWVPDWSVPLKLPLEHVTKFETYDKRFSAAKDAEASFAFRDESENNLHILSVSGVLVDTVSELGDTLTETEDPTEKLKSALQWLKALEQLSDSSTTIVTQKLQSQEEAIWRTPIQDQGTNENGNICRAPPSFGKGYKAFVTLNTEPESINLMRHYWEELEAQSRGKRLFTTSQGYLGLGPSHMHVGDELVIIHGVIVPFLLRKGDVHRTLVGEAFVHGIMDGEFMDIQS